MLKNVCISTCVVVGQMQHRFCYESSLMSAFLVALDLIRCVACLATHVIARPCSPISWYLSTVWTPITTTWSTDTSRVTTCQVAQILISLGGFSIKHCAKKSFHTVNNCAHTLVVLVLCIFGTCRAFLLAEVFLTRCPFCQFFMCTRVCLPQEPLNLCLRSFL